MHRRYMDTIALVCRFGRPDIFLTIICNPSWSETTENFLTIDEAQIRLDQILFHAKLEELKKNSL